MFENSIVAILKTVLGWRNWFDLGEIPDLGTPLTDTLTGEYYQSFSGALRRHSAHYEFGECVYA